LLIKAKANNTLRIKIPEYAMGVQVDAVDTMVNDTYLDLDVKAGHEYVVTFNKGVSSITKEYNRHHAIYKLIQHKGHIEIELNENAAVQIYTPAGLKVFDENLKVGHHQINLSQSGVFIVKINDKGEKIIINHNI